MLKIKTLLVQLKTSMSAKRLSSDVGAEEVYDTVFSNISDDTFDDNWKTNDTMGVNEKVPHTHSGKLLTSTLLYAQTHTHTPVLHICKYYSETDNLFLCNKLLSRNIFLLQNEK